MEKSRQSELSAREAEFLARARDALEHMERTGITYSVEEVSVLLTARIEARRIELLKGTSPV